MGFGPLQVGCFYEESFEPLGFARSTQIPDLFDLFARICRIGLDEAPAPSVFERMKFEEVPCAHYGR